MNTNPNNTMPQQPKKIHPEIISIQKKLKENEIYLITNKDESLTSIQNSKLQEITNFSGSNAQLIITNKKIILCTDSRYTTQAKQEIHPNIDISLSQLIKDKLFTNKTIICNTKHFYPTVFQSTQTIIHKEISTYNTSQTSLNNTPQDSTNNTLQNSIQTQLQPQRFTKYINTNFLKEQKELKQFNILYYPYGDSINTKIQQLQQKIQEHQADKFVIANYEDASWLLNIRSINQDKHVMSSKVYAILSLTTITIYTDLTLDLKKLSINTIDTAIKPLHKFDEDIKKINTKTLLNLSNYYTYNILKKYIIEHQQNWSIIPLIKRIKSNSEISQIKKIHIQDSITLIHFYAWIEQEYQAKTQLSEMNLAKKLQQLRSQNPLYICDSFDAIVGTNQNGAIIHYNTEKNNHQLQDGPLLIDSGGHYYGATTDVTRTLYLQKDSQYVQEIPAKCKYIYTTVLKAHLSIYKTIIRPPTPMSSLSTIIKNKILSQNFSTEKQKYWPENTIMTYNHGTGHGIGNCLNVHEFQHNSLDTSAPLTHNLIFSNEPGLYITNEFGVRIENATLSTQYSANNKYLTFQNLTLIPFCKKLINVQMLDSTEKNIIAEYYKQIKTQILTQIKCSYTSDWLKNELNLF